MKQQLTKRRRNEETGIIAGLALLCIALVTAVVLLLFNSFRMRTLLVEYDASRIASYFLEEYIQSSSLFTQDTADSIVGVGIYGGSGRLLRGTGNVPPTIPLPPRINPHFGAKPSIRYDSDSRTITLVRPVGMPAVMNDRLHMADRMRPGPERTFSLLLRMNAHDYYRSRAWYVAGIIAAPLLIIGLIGLLGLYYLRLRRTQREFADRERLAQLGETARTLAHEIKNPLNAMNIRIHMLRKSVTESTTEDLEAISREVVRLKTLSDRVGDFLRNPEGTPKMVDLRKIVVDTIERNEWPCEVTGPDDEYWIWFDELRLGSVVQNILANAIEATATAESSEKVSVVFAKKHQMIVLSVLDRGAGIEGVQRERLFDPFYTTKITGSGIGLSISRRFLEAAGGSLSFESRNGGGTRVDIRFRADKT